VRELRNRVAGASTPESEALKQTRSENQYLRKQLIELQSKLTGLSETLKGLAGSVSNALDKIPAEGLIHDHEAAQTGLSNEPLGGARRDQIFNPEAVDSAMHSVALADDPWMTMIRPSESICQPRWSSPVSGCLEICSDNFSCDTIPGDLSYQLPPQVPNIWSYEYQMGLQPYARALTESKSLSLTLGKAWLETNSPFSDHISTLCYLLRTKIGLIGPQYKYEMYYHPRLPDTISSELWC
jgi:threonine aldolase